MIVEEKKVETDGTSSLTFVWVETLPTTVRSRTRMTRDPNTGTITLDVTPILPCLAGTNMTPFRQRQIHSHVVVVVLRNRGSSST